MGIHYSLWQVHRIIDQPLGRYVSILTGDLLSGLVGRDVLFKYSGNLLSGHIKTSVKFAIQTIVTSTNLNYSIVCISVYDKNSSFFNISCSNP